MQAQKNTKLLRKNLNLSQSEM